MGSQNDSRSRTESRLDNTNNIGDTQTTEQWPQEEILKSSWTGREVINQRIIFHVDSDKVVEAGCREVENTGNFLCMEEIGSFIPVLTHVSLARAKRYNPHGLKVIRQKIEQRITGKKTQSTKSAKSKTRHTNRESSTLRLPLRSWRIQAPLASSIQ